MLTKVMKYDLKGLLKSVIPAYIIAILLAFSSKGLNFLADKWNIFNIPNGFILAAFVIGMIILPIYTYIMIIIRYYRTMAKDEGYLTHTLPVKKTTLINAKIIDAFIIMCASILVLAISIGIRIYGIHGVEELFIEIKNMIFSVGAEYFVLTLCIMALFQIILSVNQIFTCISLGQTHNGNKAVMSFVYAIGLYYVNQVVSTIFLILPTFLNQTWLEELKKDIPSFTFLNTYMLCALALSIIVGIIYYIINIRTLKNRLNLE